MSAVKDQPHTPKTYLGRKRYELGLTLEAAGEILGISGAMLHRIEAIHIVNDEVYKRYERALDKLKNGTFTAADGWEGQRFAGKGIPYLCSDTKLARLRVALGYTQATLGKILNVHRGYIAKLETGQVRSKRKVQEYHDMLEMLAEERGTRL